MTFNQWGGGGGEWEGGGGGLNDGKAEGANREWPRKVRDPTLTLVVGPRKRLITWILTASK